MIRCLRARHNGVPNICAPSMSTLRHHTRVSVQSTSAKTGLDDAAIERAVASRPAGAELQIHFDSRTINAGLVKDSNQLYGEVDMGGMHSHILC